MSNQTEPMSDGTRSAMGKGLSSVPAELAEQLVAQAREQGIALTGPGGLLSGLTRQVLETALQAELTEHLGHEHGGVAGPGGNIRNGHSAKPRSSDRTGGGKRRLTGRPTRDARTASRGDATATWRCARRWDGGSARATTGSTRYCARALEAQP
jgi:hypothetical protein